MPNKNTPAQKPGQIIIIGHRGASGYVPEHTLRSYDLAISQGADFIEPDLVITRDGVLIARHENEISETTDVAKKFPTRKTKKVIDGRQIEGYFTEDFTLAEIKTLRAKERLPFRSQKENGEHAVPTLDEIIKLAIRRSRELRRPIGIYPETKHPTYFRDHGLPLEDPLLEQLAHSDFKEAGVPVFIQSFEVENLKEIRKKSDWPLIQLIGHPDESPYDAIKRAMNLKYSDLLTDEGLRDLAKYASGIGPAKEHVWSDENQARQRGRPGLIARAKAQGLLVHPYTFRNEEKFILADFGISPEAEYQAFFELGVSGVFSDFPDVAVKVRSAFIAKPNAKPPGHSP